MNWAGWQVGITDSPDEHPARWADVDDTGHAEVPAPADGRRFWWSVRAPEGADRDAQVFLNAADLVGPDGRVLWVQLTDADALAPRGPR